MKVPSFIPKAIRIPLSIMSSALAQRATNSPSSGHEPAPQDPTRLPEGVPFALVSLTDRQLALFKWLSTNEPYLAHLGHHFIAFWTREERSEYLREKRPFKLKLVKVSAKEVRTSGSHQELHSFPLWKPFPRKGPVPQQNQKESSLEERRDDFVQALGLSREPIQKEAELVPELVVPEPEPVKTVTKKKIKKKVSVS